MAKQKKVIPTHYVELFDTENQEYCWRILSKNGKEICRASEPYKSKATMIRSFKNMWQCKNLGVADKTLSGLRKAVNTLSLK